MQRHPTLRSASVTAGLLLASALGAFAACSGGGAGGDDGDSTSGGAGGGGPGGGVSFAGGGPTPSRGAGGSVSTLPLHLEPSSATLVARGVPLSQPFVARLSDGTEATGVTWSMDDATLGVVSAEGVFRSKGFLGGKAVVVARLGGQRVTAEIDLKVDIVENEGGLSPLEQGGLAAGGPADAGLGFLYPYDATVFPRGVGAPRVQLGGAKATAARLLIEATNYRYEGFYALPPGLSVNQVQLPEPVWKGLVAAATPGETVRVTATTLVGGAGAGPVTQGWSVAPGSLKGIVYYNTYNSTLTQGGAVMTIRPGKSAEVLLSGCTVCHSVSSQGNRLVTALDWDDVDIENGEAPNNPIDSGSYELRPDGTAVLKRRDEDGRRYSFGALSPDGAWFLSNGVLGGGDVNGPGNEIRGLSGDLRSRLVETDTGAVVPSPTLEGALAYAMSPAFAHDGAFVAFNRRDVDGGRTLSVLNFDGKVSPPVFSGLVDLVTRPADAARPIPAWPSFLPDSKALVYHEGTGFDTYAPGSKANVRLVELATKRVRELRALNGQRPDGSSYLPFGAEDEGDMNFEPTVLPVPVGGYYWVFFTSRRAYGNTIAPYGGLVPGGEELYGWSQQPSPRKKLWLAAIDLDYAERGDGEDPSHPAFYVTGQELEAGNMRAFAALEPCRQNGVSCESGAECCGGFCRQTGVGAGNEPVLACVPPPGECSREDEACSAASDCCEGDGGEARLCINGRCAQNRPVLR